MKDHNDDDPTAQLYMRLKRQIQQRQEHDDDEIERSRSSTHPRDLRCAE